MERKGQTGSHAVLSNPDNTVYISFDTSFVRFGELQVGMVRVLILKSMRYDDHPHMCVPRYKPVTGHDDYLFALYPGATLPTI